MTKVVDEQVLQATFQLFPFVEKNWTALQNVWFLSPHAKEQRTVGYRLLHL